MKLPSSNSRTIYLLAYPDSATSSSNQGYFTVLLPATYLVIYLRTYTLHKCTLYIHVFKCRDRKVEDSKLSCGEVFPPQIVFLKFVAVSLVLWLSAGLRCRPKLGFGLAA